MASQFQFALTAAFYHSQVTNLTFMLSPLSWSRRVGPHSHLRYVTFLRMLSTFIV